MRPGLANGLWLVVRPDRSRCELRLGRATRFSERLLGLLGRDLPEPGQGIWLAPCNSVHSFGMRAAIDLLFVDRDMRVVAVRTGLRPWSVASCRAAHSTIELRAGEAERLRIDVGSMLAAVGSAERAPAVGRGVIFPAGRLPIRHPSAFQPIAEQEVFMKANTDSKANGTAKPNGEPTIVLRKSARQARAAAIAAVAAASLVSGAARADAGANMNLSAEFLDGQRGGDGEAVAAARNAEATPPALPTPDAPADSSPPDSQVGVASLPDAAGPAIVAPVSSPRAEPGIDVPRRLAEAEALYRGSRFDEALPVFRAIVEADPGHSHAWLRVGNLLHRKREWFDALTAYRRAARPQADPTIREKAIYNVALLNLELARQAVKRLERLRADGAASGTDGASSPAVADDSIGRLTDQLSQSYKALSAVYRSRSGGPAASAPTPGRAPRRRRCQRRPTRRQGKIARSRSRSGRAAGSGDRLRSGTARVRDERSRS